MTPAEEAAPARDALKGMDAVLAARPEKDDRRLTEVMENLCTWRNVLIDRHRRAPLAEVERDRLERLNAVIGVTLGVQFPQAKPPWDHFAAARDWLQALLVETTATPA